MLGSSASFANRISVYNLIERGISTANVCKYASAVALFQDKQILSQVTGLSYRSLSRRRLQDDGRNLNRDQTARLLRFAQILDHATRVFGSAYYAESWISEPALGLDGVSPLQMLLNPVGFELVGDFLARIELCVYQ